MSQSKKYSNYIDLKTNGRLFPSWVVANFSKYKLPEIMKDPNIDACNLPVEKESMKQYQLFIGKILDYNVDSAVSNISKKMKMGLYNTKIIKFDPFTCYYESIIKQSSDSYETGGKNLPKLNDNEFPNKETNAPTKTTYVLVDTGSLPTGNTQQQISKSQNKNLEETDILNQSTMRYNNLFAAKVSITIPGLFKLSAGDTIFIDSPKIENSENPDVNQQYGGKYLIADICHYITQRETYTSANLVRESFGRQA